MSYRELKTYQGTAIVYDFTVEFRKRYLDPKSRTGEQMEQAGRSGKQNIAEASSNPTSKKGELKLLGVARASLQELLEDYEDFLRQRGLKIWSKDSPEAKEVRALVYKTNWSYWTYKPYLDDPEKAANAMICLINQVNFLLDRQIKALKEKFLNEGGWTEQMFNERLRRRENRNNRSNWSNKSYEPKI